MFSKPWWIAVLGDSSYKHKQLSHIQLQLQLVDLIAGLVEMLQLFLVTQRKYDLYCKQKRKREAGHILEIRQWCVQLEDSCSPVMLLIIPGTSLWKEQTWCNTYTCLLHLSLGNVVYNHLQLPNLSKESRLTLLKSLKCCIMPEF